MVRTAEQECALREQMSHVTSQQWWGLAHKHTGAAAALMGRFIHDRSVGMMADVLSRDASTVRLYCRVGIHLLGGESCTDKPGKAKSTVTAADDQYIYRARLAWALANANPLSRAERRIARLRLRWPTDRIVGFKQNRTKPEVDTVLGKIMDGRGRIGLPCETERRRHYNCMLKTKENPKACAEGRLLGHLADQVSLRDEDTLGTTQQYASALRGEIVDEISGCRRTARRFEDLLCRAEQRYPNGSAYKARMINEELPELWRQFRGLNRSYDRDSCVVHMSAREGRFAQCRAKGGKLSCAASEIGITPRRARTLELAFLGELFNVDRRRKQLPLFPADEELPVPPWMAAQESLIKRMIKHDLWYPEFTWEQPT